MKVVYRTMRDQIQDAVAAADKTGRRIDHIRLTKREAAELADDIASVSLSSSMEIIKTGDYYYGVKIVVES
jgi:hypothetical protein